MYLTYLSIYLSTYPIYLSIYLFIYLSMYLSIFLSIYLKLSETIFWNKAILRDALAKRMSTAPKRSKVPKRSNSARAGLPQSLKLATSKRSNSVRLPSRMESWVQNWWPSYQCILWFSHRMCIKCCACPEKGRPGHTKCCACHAKSSEHPWRFYAPKCNPSQEISALTSEHIWWICCTASAKWHASFADLFQPSPHLPSFLKVLQNLHARVAHFWQGAEPLAPVDRNWCVLQFWLLNVLRATTPCTFSTSQRPKVVRDRQPWPFLTCERASPQQRALFWRGAPRMVCLSHFDMEVCLAPQQHTFWTSQRPKLLRGWSGMRFFNILS